MSQKVLVIDDDPAIHRLVAAHLATWRTELCSAVDGESGLVLAARRNPDLILLDVDMPGMNGHEVCRELKADPATRGIPILFLTAAASTAQKIMGLDMGAVDYVGKPFDPFELRARVHAGLRSKRLTDLLASRAMIDEVTGLYNRAYFERHLDAELARARRSSLPLACMVVEIDRFQEILERFGYAGGEDVLGHVASDLEKSCRREDTLCRYSDWQFAILGSSQDLASVVEIAERLRTAIASAPVICGTGAVTVTASIGIATSRLLFGCTLVTEAEEALYRAHQAGGNRVEVASELVELRVIH